MVMLLVATVHNGPTVHLPDRNARSCRSSSNPRSKVLLRSKQGGSFAPDPWDPLHPHLDVSIEEVEAQLGTKLQLMHMLGNHKEAAPAPGPETRTSTQTPPRWTATHTSLDPTAQSTAAPTDFTSKLQELLLLLPGVTQSQLLSLEAEDLQDLMEDTASVAARLVQLRTRFPSGIQEDEQRGPHRPHFLWDHPEVLGGRRWGSFLRTLPVCSLCGHSDHVTSVAIAPDGHRAVSGSRDRTLRVWDLQAQACVAALQGHGAEVLAVAVTPDGRRAVSGGVGAALRVWDLRAFACTATLWGLWGDVRSLAVTPDGRHAVSGSFSSVRVWDLSSDTVIANLQGHWGGVSAVAVTPDGRYVVSGSWDRSLRVWDLQARGCAAKMEGHTAGVLSVAVTPDGRCAVSGSSDGTLRLWDLQACACTRVLRGHMECVTAVAVTPDGRHAVSGSRDCSLRVWDLQAGTCIATLHGHSHPVTAVAITPDGCHAVSGSRDKTLQVWDLQPHVHVAGAAPHQAPPTLAWHHISKAGMHIRSAGRDIIHWLKGLAGTSFTG